MSGLGYDFEADKTISCIILIGNEKAFSGKICVEGGENKREEKGVVIN